MNLQIVYCSNRGAIRNTNEDSMLVKQQTTGKEGANIEKAAEYNMLHNILAVADGLGGHKKGDIASQTAVEALRQNSNKITSENAMKELILSIKLQLNKIAESDNFSYGLGTTLTGLYFIPENAILFHCGDSRCYGATEKQLVKLTKDHTHVQDLVDKGEISAADINSHPRKNILTSALSGNKQPKPEKIQIDRVNLQKFQRLFLCTDGVWENFSENDLLQIISMKDLEKAASSMQIEIEKKGARDNFSFILGEIV